MEPEYFHNVLCTVIETKAKQNGLLEWFGRPRRLLKVNKIIGKLTLNQDRPIMKYIFHMLLNEIYWSYEIQMFKLHVHKAKVNCARAYNDIVLGKANIQRITWIQWKLISRTRRAYKQRCRKTLSSLILWSIIIWCCKQNGNGNVQHSLIFWNHTKQPICRLLNSLRPSDAYMRR